MILKLIFAIAVMLTSFCSLKAVEIPLTPNTDRPTTRTLTAIPASVDYTDPQLATEFLYNVGNATISITDIVGNLVYHTTVYANPETVITTSTEYWDPGYYQITIQIGTKSYVGYFEVVN